MYEFRTFLESAAASLAAKRRSKQDLAKLKEWLDTLFATTRKGQPNLDTNVEFHHLIAASSHNDYFINFMQFLNAQIWEQIRGDQAQRDPVADKETALKTHREHQAIYDAIARGDHKKAGEAVTGHLLNAVRRRIIRLDL